MKCVAHLINLPWECREDCENLPPDDSDTVDPTTSSGGDSVSVVDGGNSSPSDSDDVDVFRTYKDDSSLRDQQSTGRKRAAKMYPLDELAPCEWAGKTNCGGGKKPITGCLTGLQQARHHGPDKNTLNNEQGNVHRICHTCHNRWHTLNDEGYVWGDLYEPHSPKPTDAIVIGLNEEWWSGRKVVKAKD